MNRLSVASLIATAALSLASCGSGDEPAAADPTPSASASATPSPTEAATTEPAPTGTVVEITIKNGTVTPQGKRVEVEAGEEITLHVVTDAADEIHVHSDPENEFEVAAGDDKEFTFSLKTPGQVAVESHETDQTIVQLVVR